MKKLTITTLFLLFLFAGASFVFALIITKNETRDVVGNYGAINTDSPYFSHTRIPHPNSGTSDGMIRTTDVDAYPGTGLGDFKQVRSVTISAHDHDDNTVVAIYVHAANGNWTPLVTEYDINTIGGNSFCGESSTIYGLNRHPHNDSACYVNHTFTLNTSTDGILMKFSCAQTSSGCPRNDDVHDHISTITWDIEDPATPTPNPTVTPTRTPTGTPTPLATKTPTPTLTPVPPIACWTTCTTENATSGVLECKTLGPQKLWRNPACPIDNDCMCDPTSTPTPATGGAFCPV